MELASLVWKSHQPCISRISVFHGSWETVHRFCFEQGRECCIKGRQVFVVSSTKAHNLWMLNIILQFWWNYVSSVFWDTGLSVEMCWTRIGYNWSYQLLSESMWNCCWLNLNIVQVEVIDSTFSMDPTCIMGIGSIKRNQFGCLIFLSWFYGYDWECGRIDNKEVDHYIVHFSTNIALDM